MQDFFLLDSSTSWQLYFQDAATPVMEGIINLHHDLMFFITFIFFFVLVVMARTLYYFQKTSESVNSNSRFVVHGTIIEIIWTVIPSLILIVVALPSFALLYSIDEIVDPALTLKCIGNQWFWSYEYSDYADQDGVSIEFDSYMIPESDLEAGDLRLLEVDNQLVVPTNTHVRVILASADVIHCWAVPSLGVKLDCIPGRLNQTGFLANREGVFYGQCSEICGANHAFMPISVKAVNLDEYCNHIESLLEEARD